MHGAGHAWSGLRLVADVDACAHAAIDWALVQQRARAAGVGRILAVAVLLAADLFDTSVPPAIIDAARADRVAGWLARSLARTLRTPGAPRSRDWIGVLSRERAIDGLRFGARQFYLRCVTRRTMPAA